ncbi:MAG: hypothetical protein IPO21_08360 [Bacteroidales bacterium]|nr:hypothetical protein [Bacteroidales bacterium]
MKYAFQIFSEEDDQFQRIIEIDENDSFMSFHRVIQKSVGYDKSHLASFFTADEDWNKDEEIAEIDMSDDGDLRLMEEVKLNELLSEAGQHLFYVFDYLNDRSLLITLEEIKPAKSGIKYPLCTESHGDAPSQLPTDDDDDDDYDSDEFDLDESEIKKFEKKFANLSTKDLDEDIDDLYGFEDEYDDLDSNRYDNIDDYSDRY